MNLFMRRMVEVKCLIDIEQTPESFHAHAVPQGIDIRPGDVVMLHDVPAGVAFGQRITGECRATVIRAGWFARQWTCLMGLLELTELYEVGFAAKEA